MLCRDVPDKKKSNWTFINVDVQLLLHIGQSSTTSKDEHSLLSKQGDRGTGGQGTEGLGDRGTGVVVQDPDTMCVRQQDRDT